jgi:N-sulfoglucosamine sulfohydrolase
MLKKCGYRTARIGKLHVAPDDVFKFDRTLTDPPHSRDDVKMSESCRGFIEESEDPFFLYWCSHNPHRSGDVMEDHPCKPNRFGNPEKAFSGDNERPYSDDEVEVPPYLPDTPEVRAELAQYYQSVSRLDRGIGRLMEILRENGAYDNTLVIYISDNGAAFPASKTTLYEPGMRLPCIVKRPGDDGLGGVCRGLVSWVDITPTILDFAAYCSDGEEFHGRSFKGIIGEENPAGWRDRVYGSHCLHGVTNYYPMRVIRTRKYKFIWNIAHPLPYPFASDLWRSASWQGALRKGLEMFGQRTINAYVHRPKFELYDLEDDPYESVNLAGDPEYKELVEDFCEDLREFQRQTDDPWLHKWEYE